MPICGRGAYGENSWFDWHGLKCRLCQRAIDQKEIPAWLGKAREAWYSSAELDIYFSLKGVTLRQWIKKGLLVPRTIKDDAGRVHLQLFLQRENNRMLPPKNLVQGGMVKEVVNGREEFVFVPWYRLVDPREHLKGYGNGECLRLAPVGEVHAKE